MSYDDYVNDNERYFIEYFLRDAYEYFQLWHGASLGGFNECTRMLFSGNLLRHPCFNELRELKTGDRAIGELPNTERIVRDTFWVGVYPGMTPQMLEYMIQTIRDA